MNHNLAIVMILWASLNMVALLLMVAENAGNTCY